MSDNISIKHGQKPRRSRRRIEAVSSNRGAAACTGHERGKTMSVSERTPGPYRVLAVGSVGPAERTWCARKTSRQRAGPESNKWDIYRSVACIEAEAGEEPRVVRDVLTLAEQAREEPRGRRICRDQKRRRTRTEAAQTGVRVVDCSAMYVHRAGPLSPVFVSTFLSRTVV